MNFQEISALLLVILASGYALYKFFRMFFPGKSRNPDNMCPGCSDACQPKKKISRLKIKPGYHIFRL